MSELIGALILCLAIAVVWYLIDLVKENDKVWHSRKKGNVKPGLSPDNLFDDIDRMFNAPWSIFDVDIPLRGFFENKVLTECDRRDILGLVCYADIPVCRSLCENCPALAPDWARYTLEEAIVKTVVRPRPNIITPERMRKGAEEFYNDWGSDEGDMPPDLEAKINAVSMRVEASLLGSMFRGIRDNITLITCSYCGQGIKDGVCLGCGSRHGPVRCSYCGSNGPAGSRCRGCGCKLPER